MIGSPKLAVPVRPYSDESLEGLIARSCYVNGWDRPDQVFQILGYGTTQGSWASRFSEEHAPLLATQLGCTSEELAVRFDRSIDIPHTTKAFEKLCGIPIRANLRERTVRRISPSGLRAANYHRALCLLLPFKYCAETGDELLAACPNCGKNLGWRKTYGIGFCEHCVEEGYALVDLRAVERPRLLDDDFALYKAVAGLVSTPADRSGLFPGHFQDWPAWELFDFILTLGVMLARCRDPGPLKKRGSIYASPDWHSNFMAAIKLTMSWPGSASSLVDDLERGRARRGYAEEYGRARRLGPFAHPESYAGTPRTAYEIKTTIDLAFPLTEEEKQRRWWRNGLRPLQRQEL
jgi:hypothetical protein